MTKTNTRIEPRQPKRDLTFNDLEVGEVFKWKEADWVIIKTGVQSSVVLNSKRDDACEIGCDVTVSNNIISRTERIRRIARLDITAYLEATCQ